MDKKRVMGHTIPALQRQAEQTAVPWRCSHDTSTAVARGTDSRTMAVLTRYQHCSGKRNRQPYHGGAHTILALQWQEAQTAVPWRCSHDTSTAAASGTDSRTMAVLTRYQHSSGKRNRQPYHGGAHTIPALQWQEAQTAVPWRCSHE